MISGGPDDDIIDGGEGDDGIRGDEGRDLIVGGAGHDVLYGHNDGITPDDGAVDYLYGDFGDSTLTVGAGNDRLFGGSGNDLLFGEGGDDYIDAGAGTSNLVDYGADEGPDPAGFTVPTPTPDPVVNPSWINPRAELLLPGGRDEEGRWSELAGSALDGGVSRGAGAGVEPAMVVEDGGIQYVAWADNRSGNYEIYLARHTVDTWSQLAGSAEQGGVSATAGSSRNPSLALNGAGQPMVAWVEFGEEGGNIRVARFNSALNSGQGGWEALGDSLAAGGMSGTGAADRPVILMVGGRPVVAWLDSSSGVSQVYVRQFDGMNWVELGAGTAGGQGVSHSSTGATELSASTDGSRVALAWVGSQGGGRQIHVAQYNGTSWSLLSGTEGLGTPAMDSTAPAVAYHDGDLFVAWEQEIPSSGYDREIYVARYHGGAWTDAGVGAMTGEGVSSGAGAAAMPRLASGGGKLHLVWADTRIEEGVIQQSALCARVWDGTEFREELPGDASGYGTGATRSGTVDISLCVDGSGHPFVAWQESGNGGSSISVRAQLLDMTGLYVVDGGLSIQTILNTYDLGPGDVILVNPGTHAGGFTVSGDDAGVTLYGAPGAAISGSVVVESSAENVTIQHLAVGGDIRVNGADGFTLRGSTVNGGVHLSGGSGARLSENLIQGGAAGLEILGESGITYESETLADSPIGYWRLGETAGSVQAVDASGNGNSGLYGGSVGFGSTGALTNNNDAAIVLDGGQDRIGLPPHPSGRCRRSDNGLVGKNRQDRNTDHDQRGQWRQRQRVHGRFRDRTRLRLYTGETSAGYVSWNIASIADNQWHMVAVTRNGAGDTAELYVDGVSQGTKATALNPLTIQAGGLVVGQYQSAVGVYQTARAFVGSLDELGLYGSVLSAARIQALYQRGVEGPIFTGGPEDLEVVDNTIQGNLVGVSFLARAGGVVSGNDISSPMVGMRIAADFSGLISGNEIHGSGTGLVYEAGRGARRESHLREQPGRAGHGFRGHPGLRVCGRHIPQRDLRQHHRSAAPGPDAEPAHL